MEARTPALIILSVRALHWTKGPLMSTMKLNLPTAQLCEIKVRASNLQLGAHNKVTKMPTPELGWREKREKLRIIK